MNCVFTDDCVAAEPLKSELNSELFVFFFFVLGFWLCESVTVWLPCIILYIDKRNRMIDRESRDC